MWINYASVMLGLIALVWSADKFVSGSSQIAKFYGVPPLVIGMVIVGFGTSAPEMIVSAIASYQGSPGIALGNAFGSNITNIALILGLTTILKPISVHSQVLKKELPILIVVTLICGFLIYDLSLSRIDAVFLIFIFSLVMFWTMKGNQSKSEDSFGLEVELELNQSDESIKKSFFNLSIGLVLLITSSRILVHGATAIAISLGVSDLIIGLTIVAVGTSLPELASSIIAAKKGESDIALGNVIGSNLFNTLAVLGIAGLINPLTVDQAILKRDLALMTFLTIILFLFSVTSSKIGRVKGGILLIVYILYIIYLVSMPS